MHWPSLTRRLLCGWFHNRPEPRLAQREWTSRSCTLVDSSGCVTMHETLFVFWDGCKQHLLLRVTQAMTVRPETRHCMLRASETEYRCLCPGIGSSVPGNWSNAQHDLFSNFMPSTTSVVQAITTPTTKPQNKPLPRLIDNLRTRATHAAQHTYTCCVL